ncbi:MAG: hypothetical protein ABSG33_02270 [Candidatus Bathyarchaeia archaeon]
MSIEQWLENNTVQARRILAKRLLAKLSRITVATIFDEECADCTQQAKLKDCFIPFLSDTERIKLCLKLFLLGVVYSALQPTGFAGLITAEVFATIEGLHAEFIKWTQENCPIDKKVEAEKAGAYVA